MGTIVNHEGEGGHDTHAGGEPRQCSQFDSTPGEYDSQRHSATPKKEKREKERKRESRNYRQYRQTFGGYREH